MTRRASWRRPQGPAKARQWRRVPRPDPEATDDDLALYIPVMPRPSDAVLIALLDPEATETTIEAFVARLRGEHA